MTRAGRRARRARDLVVEGLRGAASSVPLMGRRRRLPPGTAPGTLVADPNAQASVVRVMAWGPDGIVEEEGADLERIDALRKRWPVTWVNVDGLGDVDLISNLGRRFGLHRLALEDVVNTGQRAKAERYPQHLFLVAQMIALDGEVHSEQLSIFVGRGLILTFQEHQGDCFEPVRTRAREGRGRLRQAGAGYLAYALMDAVVDNYFPVLERFGERLQSLEDAIIDRPEPGEMERIHDVRRNLLVLRRSIWPLREMLHGLLREPSEFIDDEDRLYIQDVYDHAVQVMDLIENYREIGSGLMDIYLSSLSNRMNEVMKVLTMFAAFFIPLSFIAGLYGMNFDTASPWNMPELGWRYGYLFVLGLMAAVALGLLVFFWSRGWLGRGPRGGGKGGA